MEGLNSLVYQRIQFACLDSFLNFADPTLPHQNSINHLRKASSFNRDERAKHFLFDFFNVTHESRFVLLATNEVYHKAIRRKPSFQPVIIGKSCTPHGAWWASTCCGKAFWSTAPGPETRIHSWRLLGAFFAVSNQIPSLSHFHC